MNNLQREIRTGIIILSALALLTVGLSACSDDDLVCPDYQIGAIEGYITEAGEPAEGIDVVVSEYYSLQKMWARPDSSGHFRFDLANGLYLYSIHEAGSDVIGFSTQDSIRVASNVVPLNFTFGQAEVRVSLPPELEGRRCLLWMSGRQMDRGGASTTVVDGQASFSVHRLNPGAYTMSFSAGTLTVDFPPASPPDAPLDTLQVGTEMPATFAIDLSGSYASLQGAVTGAWQTLGGSPPSVKIYSPDSEPLGRVTPDADGNFTVGVLTPTRFVLKVYDWSGLSFFYGGDSPASATQFDLKPGDRLTGIEIPEARIRLTLRGPGGMINHRAAARLIDPQGYEHDITTYSYHEPLVIGGLAPGRYFLQVNGYKSRQTWAAQWYGGADSLAAATPIVVSAGAAVDLVMDLVPGGSIAGQVVLFGSQPLVPISCALFDSTGQPLAGDDRNYWDTYDSGACSFPGLPDGTFYLAAKQSYSDDPVWYPGTRDFAQATPITLTDHNAVTGLTWDLYPDQKERP